MCKLKSLGYKYETFYHKDENIVNLSNSILKYMDIETNEKTLNLLDTILEEKDYTNIILQIYDGLGINILMKNAKEDSILRKGLETTITSIFPSSTVAATTSILTGTYPGSHGWARLGYVF